MTIEEMREKMNGGPITRGEMKEILSSSVLDAELDECGKDLFKYFFNLYCELEDVGEANEVDLEDLTTFIDNCTNQKGEYFNQVASYFDEAKELEKEGIYTSFSIFDKNGNQVLNDAYKDESSMVRGFLCEVREIKFIHYIASPDIKKVKEVSIVYVNNKIEISSTVYHKVKSDVHEIAKEFAALINKERGCEN